MDSATQTLIAEMEHAINRLRHISAQHNQIPLSLENTEVREELYNQFETEKCHFYLSYGQDKSFRLEALHKPLFTCFNQYLIDYVSCIDELHQAPTFVEYLFSLSQESWQTMK